MNRVLLSVLFLSTVLLSACSRQEPIISPTPSPVVTAEPTSIPVVIKDVVLQNPNVTEAISPPLRIAGLAPGNWFFEGQIQGDIISESGELLDTFPLMAVGNWMTEDHVEFEGEADFNIPLDDKTVQLIIKNDNPSGLPENEKSQMFELILEK